MIVPNISFDPEIDDFTSLFSSVFNRVEKQLELYDKVESKFQDSLKFDEHNRLKSKISKVRSNIISSQNQTDLIAKEVDSMNQWMISLEEQKKTIMNIDNIQIPEGFIQKFSTNSSMMKEFEHDLLFYLRNYINSYETPQVLRLKECFKRSMKMKIDRLEMYETISDRCQQAEKKFIEVDAENKNLTTECQKSDETLARFSTSESYALVQKAKRQKFIIEDWSRRKKELLDEIDTLKIDLEMYKEDNKDKSSNTSILRKVQEVEENYSKALSKWNEQVRLVEEDFKVSITHQQSMLKQLEKDLLSNQLQLLASEKKKTMTEFRAMQASSNRTVSKFTSNRHSLNRKIEASFRKKALSFQEAVEMLKTFHNDELSSLKTIMDGVVEDIKNVIKMRKDDSDNSTSSYLTKINNQIELLRATTETAKRRINMGNIEKDIELKAINNQLVTVQGVVNDVFDHCSECEKLHNQLEEKMREISAKKNELYMQMKIDIEKNQTFINSVNFLIIRLNEFFEKIEAKCIEKNNGDGFIFSKKFKEKALKRSFSMTQFKKLTFEDIISYKYKRKNESRKNEKSYKENSIFKSKEISIPLNENKTNFQINTNISNEKENKVNLSSNTSPLPTTTKPNTLEINQPNKNENNSIANRKAESSTSALTSNINTEIYHSEQKIEIKKLDNPQSQSIDLNKNESIIENEEKTSQKVSPDIQFLTPPKKNFLIPQPPTALSPVPPAKRKILTLSTSAASLCGQITIFEPTEEIEEVKERSIKLNIEEKNETENKKENKEEEISIKKTTQKSEDISITKKISNSIEPSTNNTENKTNIIKKTAIITENVNKEKNSSSSSINSNNNKNNTIQNNSNKSIELKPASSPSSSTSPDSLPLLAASSNTINSTISNEKVKQKSKVKIRSKNHDNILNNNNNNLSSSSSISSTNVIEDNINKENNNNYKYEKIPEIKNNNDKINKNEEEKSNEIKSDKENNSDDSTQIFEFRLNTPKSNQQTGKESSTGRIKIEYDKSLTATIEKKKKKKISISPRRKKPPKQIPNEQPSFVNNRPPRHLTITTPSGYKNVFARTMNNNNNVNVNIVNINETVSTQIQIVKNSFHKETSIILNDENDTDKIDDDDNQKTIKKKTPKKLSVKKKTKKNTDNYLKKKKAADQKINGKVLAFSLPTAERRALSVKHAPRNSIADSLLLNNGSLNLNNRINGNIISVQHF